MSSKWEPLTKSQVVGEVAEGQTLSYLVIPGKDYYLVRISDGERDGTSVPAVEFRYAKKNGRGLLDLTLMVDRHSGRGPYLSRASVFKKSAYVKGSDKNTPVTMLEYGFSKLLHRYDGPAKITKSSDEMILEWYLYGDNARGPSSAAMAVLKQRKPGESDRWAVACLVYPRDSGLFCTDPLLKMVPDLISGGPLLCNPREVLHFGPRPA